MLNSFRMRNRIDPGESSVHIVAATRNQSSPRGRVGRLLPDPPRIQNDSALSVESASRQW
jgi:hypothetical protein